MARERIERKSVSRRASALICLLFTLFAVQVACAAEPPDRVFQIPTQPVAQALHRFAQQAQVQLIFSEQDVQGLQSTEVSGTLTPRAALERLLEGTPLEFQFTRSNVAVVRKTRAPASSLLFDPSNDRAHGGPVLALLPWC